MPAHVIIDDGDTLQFAHIQRMSRRHCNVVEDAEAAALSALRVVACMSHAPGHGQVHEHNMTRKTELRIVPMRRGNMRITCAHAHKR